MARPLLSRIGGALAAALLAGVPGASLRAQTGFTHERVVTSLTNPTAIAFDPDGRIFVTEQGGNLRIVKQGSLLPSPFVSLVVDSRRERGLLGVALDPDFPSNHYVYVYYTATKPAYHNRVSRFVADGDVARAGSERILLELDDLSPAMNHNGGAMHFGPDGKLYIAVGENSHGRNAQTLENLLGKILRINADGTIPFTNPFYGQAQGRNRAIWAMGLRNPFTFAFKPRTSRMHINDVGQDTWEEIDVGKAGANYGWPIYEGPEDDPLYEPPLYAYKHSSGCAITGGTFYDPPTVQFPAHYVDDYFFADYCKGDIRRMDFPTRAVSEFSMGLAGPVDLQVNPQGFLYYLVRGGYAEQGEIWRIKYTGSANRGPTARPAADPTYGAVPLVVTFDGVASTDPDGDALTYTWTFGDGTPPAPGQTVAHVYPTEGRYYATLTVTDGREGEDSMQVRIDPGHSAPQVTMQSPSAGQRFRVGEEITLRANATDEQGRQLPDSSLSWTIYVHHEDHTHPFLGPRPGNGIVITGPEPEGLSSTTTTHLAVRLTATDARGLSATMSRDLYPKTVRMTFDTAPTGLQFKLNGPAFTAPRTVTSWQGWDLLVEAPDQTDGSGRNWRFVSWSDGGARRHTIVSPGSATTYTATFQQAP